MLAEKRRKQRIAPDPRNKSWTNEETNNVGMKLLSKMGWSKGKGLGKDEQGLSTSDKLMSRPKIDNKGFGCETKDVEAWENGGTAFDSILARLNEASSSEGEKNHEKPSTSAENQVVEEKSKKFLKRLRYKNTKLKIDSKKFSGEDLKCILGRRKLTEQENYEAPKKFHKTDTLFAAS
uniref:PinX1-related protein 1 n=1 Tax=Romanomermis culicivorax TaxID=13658 RepID=A0A915JSS2_ROMCU